MHFLALNATSESAVLTADRISRLQGSALSQLTLQEQSSIANFFAYPDADGDGLADADEPHHGTRADDMDTDDDGLLDGFEVRYGLDPLAAGEQHQDPDGDGLDNLAEQAARGAPGSNDSDGDGLLDAHEVLTLGTNPASSDTDADGLSDLQEVMQFGTNPNCRDTDGGGASDFQEVAIDLTDPLGVGDDLVAISFFPVRIVDGLGFGWWVHSDGHVNNYESSAGFFLSHRLSVNGKAFPEANGKQSMNGRTLQVGPGTFGALQVRRRLFVPTDDGFVRYLEILDNTADTEQAATLSIESQLGSGPTTTIVATSNGDRIFETDDTYIVTDDADGSERATVAWVIQGPGGETHPSSVGTTIPWDDDLSLNFSVTVPPRGRVVLMHLASQRANRAAALQSAEALTRLQGSALTDLTPAMRARISNWVADADQDSDGLPDNMEAVAGTNPADADSDDDGLLDGFEVSHGLDPLHAGDQSGDPDGDGLNNLAEQGAGTSASVPDTDGDGILDGVEVRDRGTNPRSRDTDSDSVPDASDNCPVTANPDQNDEGNPNGIGDACEDTDGDGFLDDKDNCAGLANPAQANADGDRLGDDCDPFPAVAIRAISSGPATPGSWVPTAACRWELNSRSHRTAVRPSNPVFRVWNEKFTQLRPL